MNEMFRKNLSTRVVRVDGEYKDDGYIAKNKNRDRVVAKSPIYSIQWGRANWPFSTSTSLSIVLRRTRGQDKEQK